LATMSYRQTKFENGVKLTTVPQTEALSASILFLVDAGAKNEEKSSSGLSHFLEHMAFKGTKACPSSFALTSRFDALGANYNAFTGYDFTGYYVTVVPDKAEEAASLLADLYLNPLYPTEEIDKEKGVVLEEIKMYEDKPASLVWDVYATAAYGDHPAGRPVLGVPGTVSAFSRDDLAGYRKKHYLASATTIAVVGNFDEDKLTELLRGKFFAFNGGSPHPWPKLIGSQVGPNLSLVSRPIKQTHLVLGFQSATLFDDDELDGLNILAAVLGGGMSSRLFQRVREELGAAYYVGANQNSHVDHGFLTVYAGVDAGRTQEVLSVLVAELRRLKNEAIPAEELNKVKDGFIGNLFLGLETPSDQSFFYGEQVILGRPVLDPLAYAEKIRAVDAASIKRLAEKIFVANRATLALVGPEALFKLDLRANLSSL